MKIDKIKPVFSDDRGDIYDILTDESIQHVGLFTIAKNAVRKRIAVPAWRISIVSELEANALCKTLVSSDLERFKIVILG